VPQPLTLALVAALSLEARPFLRRQATRSRGDLNLPAWEFPRGEGQGLLVLSGMGRDRARLAAELILDRFRPQILISLGFAGALTPELTPGALVVGEAIWDYQPDTGLLEEVTGALSPRPPRELARRLLEAGLPAFSGTCVTTPAIIDKRRQGAPLQNFLHPALDLETGALAAVAAAANIPLLCLRAITDAATEEIPEFLRSGETPGAREALAWLAQDPRRAAVLLRLWRRARFAARQLADALEILLPLITNLETR
jgi:adenosylhomocysteine nucleosidase